MSPTAGPALAGRRLVVIAPHPDDEVLCAGGLMRAASLGGGHVTVVAVTDGEASHASSQQMTGAALREQRCRERTEALSRLGVHDAAVVRLGFPDQGGAAQHHPIADALRGVLLADDIVVGPSSADRHPDHVAVASAVADAAGPIVERWWEAPTWALVHRTAPPPSWCVELDGDAWAAKQHAMAAYRSQLVPLGPDPADGPVIHPHELALMLRPVEGFVSRCGRSR